MSLLECFQFSTFLLYSVDDGENGHIHFESGEKSKNNNYLIPTDNLNICPLQSDDHKTEELMAPYINVPLSIVKLRD